MHRRAVAQLDADLAPVRLWHVSAKPVRWNDHVELHFIAPARGVGMPALEVDPRTLARRRRGKENEDTGRIEARANLLIQFAARCEAVLAIVVAGAGDRDGVRTERPFEQLAQAFCKLPVFVRVTDEDAGARGRNVHHWH